MLGLKKEKISHLFLYFLLLFSIVNSEDETTELTFGKIYNQTSLTNEEHFYSIDLLSIKNLKKVFIDVIIFTGDVEVNTHFTHPNDLSVGHYQLINKIFLSVKIKPDSPIPDKLVYSIKAKSNAFYMLINNFAVEDIEDSLITNEIETGFSYLVTIDPSLRESYDIANKIVRFKNPNVEDKKPILVSFFSLNCQIEVGQVYRNQENTLIYAESYKYDHFSYDLIDPTIETEKDRYVENLEFRINIVQLDKTLVERNLCKVYVSANEVSQNHEEGSKDIIVPNNIDQQVIFGKDFKHVSYGYVHLNMNKDLMIKFNLKHKAQYTIRIYYNFEKAKKDKTIVSNEILYLNSYEWREQCSESEKGCYIQLDITLENVKDIENPILEFTIKTIGTDSVSYLAKNVMKLDYTHNINSQYYYTELGESEEGFVTINFLRGSGNIYARIVEENNSEQDGNWRGKYVLPNEKNSLKLDAFTRKISFNTFDKDCKNGCYLLINVMSDIKSLLETNYPFSIIIHIHEFNIMNYQNIPLIRIPNDEYVVGTVSEYTTKDYIYQFYSVWLNSDCEQVLIDFQSKTGALFINVGYERPTTFKSNFKILSNGKDQVLSIKKDKILELAKEIKEYRSFTSIRDITLTIGVWTNLADSRDTTPFAFVIRLDTGINDIYRVNSDQKALCTTKKISENKYRCIYAIEYDYISAINFLFIYPKAKSKTPLMDVYGSIIDQIDYEIDPNNKLIDLIPNQNNYNYSNHDSSDDFLYIKKGFAPETYFLVSVETDTETTIELLTSFYIYQNSSTANPRTPQLFIISSGTTFTLKFPEDYKEMVNIGCIAGKAEIFWESDPTNKFYVGGEEDKISITSEKSGKSHILNFVPKTILSPGLGFIFM